MRDTDTLLARRTAALLSAVLLTPGTEERCEEMSADVLRLITDGAASGGSGPGPGVWNMLAIWATLEDVATELRILLPGDLKQYNQ